MLINPGPLKMLNLSLIQAILSDNIIKNYTFFSVLFSRNIFERFFVFVLKISLNGLACLAILATDSSTGLWFRFFLQFR